MPFWYDNVRPSRAREALAVASAAETNPLKVFAWDNRRQEHTEQTKPITCWRLMVASFQRVVRAFFHKSYRQRVDHLIYLQIKTGDESAGLSAGPIKD
jgi:hypothetical protein